jgi:hypothetical protein
MRLWIAALNDQNRDANFIVEVDALTRSAWSLQLTRVEASSGNLFPKASPGLGCGGMTGNCRAEDDVSQHACQGPIWGALHRDTGAKYRTTVGRVLSRVEGDHLNRTGRAAFIRAHLCEPYLSVAYHYPRAIRKEIGVLLSLDRRSSRVGH